MVPATGSSCKSRDYQRSHSDSMPRMCGIGSPSKHLFRCYRLRTRGHRHKLGRSKFQTTLRLQERRNQISVSLRFSPRRSLLVFQCLLKSTPQRENKSPLFDRYRLRSSCSHYRSWSRTNTAPAYPVFSRKPEQLRDVRCKPLRRAVPAKWTRQPTWLTASANDSSPAIWWCTRARSCASATASWATRCRTAATSSGGDHHIINRRMNGDAMMMLGRGRYREGDA
jgi:hypothetical protein